MIIKKLILHKYKRFFLNNIETLEYTPQSPMQIILGTNGSGKSQLLKQLNPLPPLMKNEFQDGGYKYIEIEHNNNLYKLRSEGIKHSFLVNDKELNDGGTRKAQLELVKDHFRLTPDIIEIFLNNTRLTNMSPSERKKWLTELSHIDYTYSISVYNKLKQKHRDILGGITLVQDEIVKLEKDIENNEDIKLLEENKKYLVELNNHILSLYRPTKNINFDINRIKIALNTDKHLLSVRLDYDQLTDDSIKYNTIIEETNKKIKELITKIEKLNAMPPVDDINIVKTKMENITKEINALNTQIDSFDGYSSSFHIVEYNNILEEVGPILVDLINKFTEVYKYKDYDYEQLSKQHEEYKSKLLILTNKMKLLKSDMEHMDKCKNEEHKLTCPKCFHNWYNGYDEKKYQELLQEYNKLKEESNTLVNKFKELDNILPGVSMYDNYEKSILHYITTTTPLRVYFTQIGTDGSDRDKYIREPYEMLSKLNEVIVFWSSLKSKLPLLKQEQEIYKQYEIAKKLHEHNINSIKDKIKEYKDELNKLMADKNKAELDLNKTTDRIVDCECLMIIQDDLLEQLNLNRHYVKNEVKALRNKYLKTLNNIVEEEIAILDNKIDGIKIYNSKYSTNKKLLEDYKKKENVLKLMLKELSPTEGLIAKSINSFLNIFIREINNIINSIWSYEIELLTCDITDDNDLDYKFKVRVNNDEVIEDISKLSSSMKEIIDLAFRIVFTKYLHMTDYPLFLDEFGHSFDNKHRVTAYNIIDKVLKIDYPQIFIVCHYESLYGSLNNCDFNVLSSNNIELDSITTYNQNLKIK